MTSTSESQAGNRSTAASCGWMSGRGRSVGAATSLATLAGFRSNRWVGEQVGLGGGREPENYLDCLPWKMSVSCRGQTGRSSSQLWRKASLQAAPEVETVWRTDEGDGLMDWQIEVWRTDGLTDRWRNGLMGWWRDDWQTDSGMNRWDQQNGGMIDWWTNGLIER